MDPGSFRGTRAVLLELVGGGNWGFAGAEVQAQTGLGFPPFLVGVLHGSTPESPEPQVFKS